MITDEKDLKAKEKLNYEISQRLTDQQIYERWLMIKQVMVRVFEKPDS